MRALLHFSGFAFAPVPSYFPLAVLFAHDPKNRCTLLGIVLHEGRRTIKMIDARKRQGLIIVGKGPVAFRCRLA